MATQRIDGSGHTGTYRVECECGAAWDGATLPEAHGAFSPALMVVEAVEHNRQEHAAELCTLEFSARVHAWLIVYWNAVTGAPTPAANRGSSRPWRQRHA